jgi:hypothetical protein
MELDSLHYWLPEERFEDGHTLRTYTIGHSNGDEIGTIYCRFETSGNSATFRIQLGEVEILQWECRSKNQMG